MLNFISYFGISMGIIFIFLYTVSAPFFLPYRKVSDDIEVDIPRPLGILALIILIAGLLNLLSVVVIVIFSGKLITIVTGLLIIILSVGQAIIDRQKKKIFDPKVAITVFSWLTFILMIIVTLVMRLLPFITYLRF
ncbi:MAG TPA: hypothetical protein VF837_02410 [Patescibacteria group bacterium]